jgi:hypothetical protein
MSSWVGGAESALKDAGIDMFQTGAVPSGEGGAESRRGMLWRAMLRFVVVAMVLWRICRSCQELPADGVVVWTFLVDLDWGLF